MAVMDEDYDLHSNYDKENTLQNFRNLGFELSFDVTPNLKSRELIGLENEKVIELRPGRLKNQIPSPENYADQGITKKQMSSDDKPGADDHPHLNLNKILKNQEPEMKNEPAEEKDRQRENSIISSESTRPLGLWPENKIPPSFFVIGVRKGGTTSLFRYLEGHPDFAPPKQKEIQFFNLNYHRDLRWYAKYFPEKEQNNQDGRRTFSGEATVAYFSSCEAPARIWTFIKENGWKGIKFLLLLRNPVDRILSTHLMRLRENNKAADADFNLAIAQELEKHATCLQNASKVKGDGYDKSHELCFCQPSSRHVPGFLVDSFYDHHITRWQKYFPSLEKGTGFAKLGDENENELLILNSEALRKETLTMMRLIENFLGIQPHDYGSLLDQHWNERESSQNEFFVSMDTRQRLVDLFNPTVSWVRDNFGIEL